MEKTGHRNNSFREAVPERLLFVNGCVNRDRSRTLRLAKALMDRIGAGQVDEIILEEAGLAPLDSARLLKRSELAEKGLFGDQEFAEARRYASADVLVVATPYWEHGFNALTKIYLENVSQLGIAFMYGDDGASQGLTRIARAYYVTTRGGPTDDESDLGYGMFKKIMEMHGISDVRILSAKALDIVGNDPEAILGEAMSRIDSVVSG